MGKTENEINKDSNFDEIKRISIEIFEVAKEKMKNGEVKTNIDDEKIKKELRELLDKVDFLNEIEAKRLVSEAMLDLDYISNSDVKILSLRLGQIYVNKA